MGIFPYDGIGLLLTILFVALEFGMILCSVADVKVDLANPAWTANHTVGINHGTIYFNNPHLLRKEPKQNQNRKGQMTKLPDLTGQETPADGFLLDESSIIGFRLRRIANEELSVTSMQGIYDSLPFQTVPQNDEQQIEEMSERITSKIRKYSQLMWETKRHVEDLFWWHLQHPISHVLPCCSLDKKFLTYNDHFGTRVSMQHVCDALPEGYREGTGAFLPGQNLTQFFHYQALQQSSIKWQYFISPSGVHSEYPAHGPDVIGRTEDACAQQGENQRHRHLFLATLKPEPKHVVIVMDHGNSLSAHQLATAKSAAKYVLSLLSHTDKVALMGVASDVSFSMGGSCGEVRRMVSATSDTQLVMSRFVDGLEKSKDATNHSAGFRGAYNAIQSSFANDVTFTNTTNEVAVIYISRGLLSSLTEAKFVMETIASFNYRNTTSVVINTYALVDETKPLLYEKTFLLDLAEQNFEKYEIVPSISHRKKGEMFSLASSNDFAQTLGTLYKAFSSSLPKTAALTHSVPETGSKPPIFSLPYWDTIGKGLIVSLTHPCYSKTTNILGVVGIDLHLSDIVEDITYYSTNGFGSSYTFMMDNQGHVLMHPSFSRPGLATEKPLYVDIAVLERHRKGFKAVRAAMLKFARGRTVLKETFLNANDSQDSSKDNDIYVKYNWKALEGTPYILCIVTIENSREVHTLKAATISNYDDLVYHNVHLINHPPSKYCRHFRQTATIDASGLFLSAGAFLSPFEHLGNVDTKRSAQTFMAYLADNTKLISNPGLKGFVRQEVLALSKITTEWKDRLLHSELNKYIVRRFASTLNGVFITYPATTLDTYYDPTRRPWFMRAMEYPGHVVLTAPYLDVGGAGYVVTVSHTIYEGKSAAMHSSADGIQAVIGVDFTLGYFYRLLVGTVSICNQDHVTCLIFDDRGYLIAHPGLIEANNRGPIEQQHLTHKEPLVVHDLLTNHKQFVQKRVCSSFSDRTVQRYYQFNTSIDSVVANLVHGEHCAKYQIAAIPGTNSFIAVVNQTCESVTTFCPCSMVDRLCLNCHRVEQSECECPCECPLDPCLWDGLESGVPFATSSNVTFEARVTGFRSQIPTCPTFPEELRPLSGPDLVGSLWEQMDACMDTACALRHTENDCFGVIDCEWCQMEPDGATLLHHPFCSQQRRCFGGVLGARTPYADEIIGLDIHDDDDIPFRSTPVGPVAGGIMVSFLIIAMGLYCYRHHLYTRRHQHQFYTNTGSGGMMEATSVRMSHLGEDEEGDNEGLWREEKPAGILQSNVVLASFETAAGISPYRLANAPYRRPTACDSDHGYSTMTPNHEDSEHTAEPLLLLGGTGLARTDSRERSYEPASSGTESWSRDRYKRAGLDMAQAVTRLTVVPTTSSGSSRISPIVCGDQTVLPDSRYVLAPVQVHYADVH